MASTKIEEFTTDLNELKVFLLQATRPRVKEFLSTEIRKVETKLIELHETVRKETPSTPSPIATSLAFSTSETAGTTESKRYQVELNNYAFDQSEKFVKLFVTLDGVQACSESQVTVEFTTKTINLQITNFNNKDYKLEIKNLLEPIDVEKSYRKIKSNIIAIYAKKVKEGSKWSDLTLIQRRLNDIKSSDISDSMKDDKDPTSGLMKVMKKMYDSGDSEMKRMITKAWVEGEEKKRAGGQMNDLMN